MDRRLSAVLFDIGGVLVALDGVPAMAKLLDMAPDHETLHAMWLASPSVVAHETGKIDAAAFAAGAVRDFRLPVTADRFLREFRSWPTGLLPGALQLLDEIPDDYRVAALSNTSAVHWERISEMGFVDRFEQTYLSHELGCLKPADEAFLAALDGMGLAPAEVLFLDDGMRNVEAAARLGMHAHLARGPDEARRVLADSGVVRGDSGA